MSEDFCKHHFLVGLLMQEVRTSLNEIVQIRKVAISTLRDLMAKHELDDRYQNKVNCFYLFLPLYFYSNMISYIYCTFDIINVFKVSTNI